MKLAYTHDIHNGPNQGCTSSIPLSISNVSLTIPVISPCPHPTTHSPSIARTSPLLDAQKLADIGAERDAAFERAEKAESELRDAKLTIARYERENSDLAGKVGRLEEEVDVATAKAGQLSEK